MINSNIARGAIVSYISIFLNIALLFFYTPWMIKQIGVSNYGLYNLVISFISYFIMDFGLGTALSRFISKYRAEGDLKKVENILGLTERLYLVIDAILLIIFFICYCFITSIFGGLTREEIEILKVLFLIAGGFGILTFTLRPIDGAMVAFEYFVPNKFIDMVNKIGAIILIIIALLLGGDVYVMVLINGIMAFVTSLLKYCIWLNKSKLKINFRYFDKEEAKSIFFFSSWIFTQSMADRFRISLIPTVLGIFSNSNEIALFGLAMSIESMLWTLSSALNGLFLPKVSKLVYNGDKREIMSLMIRVGRIQLFITLFIISAFFVGGTSFIRLWVGSQFNSSFYIVLCLSVTYLIANTMRIASDMVYAQNKVKYTAKVIFSTSLLGLMGSVMVASRFGAIGCACCSGVALIITQIGYLRIYKNVFSVDIAKFFRECHGKILIKLIPVVLTYFLLVKFWGMGSWLELAAGTITYTFIYFVVSYFFLFNEEEKRLVCNLIKK